MCTNIYNYKLYLLQRQTQTDTDRHVQTLSTDRQRGRAGGGRAGGRRDGGTEGWTDSAKHKHLTKISLFTKTDREQNSKTDYHLDVVTHAKCNLGVRNKILGL